MGVSAAIHGYKTALAARKTMPPRDLDMPVVFHMVTPHLVSHRYENSCSHVP
jgi:hypothetical protein